MGSVDELLQLAKDALALKELEQVPEFVEKTEAYLNELEVWQKSFTEEEAQAVDDSLKQKITELQALHQQLMSRAGIERDQVGTEMSNLHKKASGLRKYVDRFPKSISITGKRKG